MARTSWTSEGLGYSVRALRHRNFLIFWLGALVSNTGTWLANLTVPYVLFQLTGSAVWTGIASLTQFAPQVLLTPVAGRLADRVDRRRLLLSTQAGMAVAAAGMWLAWLVGAGHPGPLLVLVAFSGIFQGLNMPAWQAFVNDLVPRRDLVSAVTLNSVQFNAARSLGPAIAGILLAAFGPTWAFLLNAVSFTGVIIALLSIRLDHRPPAPPAATRGGEGFLAALRYVGRQPGIVMAIVVSFLIGLLGNPILQFTVVFATSVFMVGPTALGLMNAAFGVGSVVAAPLIAGSERWSRATITRVSLLLQGLGLVGFAVAPGTLVATICLLVMGAGFLGSISSANTSLQMIVTPQLRGRVIAVRIMIYSASFPLGAMVQTALADIVGPRIVVGVAGVLLSLCALVFSVGATGRLLSRLDDPADRSDEGCVPDPVRV